MLFDDWRRDRPPGDAADAADADGAESVDSDGGAGRAGACDGGDAASDTEGSPTTTPAPVGPRGLIAAAPEVPSADQAGGPALDETAASLDVDDVAAYLAGRLVEYRSGRGRGVPAWAVLNKVAHADVDELAGLADGAGDGREPGWLSAQRSLAADLLAERDPPDVARIQRQVLVPLELWLIARSETETVSGRWAAELAADVLTACGRRGG